VTEFLADKKDIIHYRKNFLSFNPDVVIDVIAYTAQDAWNLIQALKGVTNNLLLLSSGDVYGAYDVFHRNLPDIDNSPLTEKSSLRRRLYPYRPDGIDQHDDLLYNYEKILVENIIQREIYNAIILRLPAVFGPEDKQQKLSEYIVPMITNQPSISISSKKANWIWTRSYVENVAFAIFLAATSQGVKNEIFNVGAINLKEIELVRKLKELTGWEGEIILKGDLEEIYNYSQNIQMEDSKIRRVLNYETVVDEESAFLQTIKSYC
jgi:nucleoside-diphosphate-sugar epimerase